MLFSQSHTLPLNTLLTGLLPPLKQSRSSSLPSRPPARPLPPSSQLRPTLPRTSCPRSHRHRHAATSTRVLVRYCDYQRRLRPGSSRSSSAGMSSDGSSSTFSSTTFPGRTHKTASMATTVTARAFSLLLCRTLPLIQVRRRWPRRSTSLARRGRERRPSSLTPSQTWKCNLQPLEEEMQTNLSDSPRGRSYSIATLYARRARSGPDFPMSLA